MSERKVDQTWQRNPTMTPKQRPMSQSVEKPVAPVSAEGLREALTVIAPYVEFYMEREINSPSNGEEDVREAQEALRIFRRALTQVSPPPQGYIATLDLETHSLIVVAHAISKFPTEENFTRLRTALSKFDSKHEKERTNNLLRALEEDNSVAAQTVVQKSKHVHGCKCQFCAAEEIEKLDAAQPVAPLREAIAKWLHWRMSAAQNLPYEDGDTCEDCFQSVDAEILPMMTQFYKAALAQSSEPGKEK